MSTSLQWFGKNAPDTRSYQVKSRLTWLVQNQLAGIRLSYSGPLEHADAYYRQVNTDPPAATTV